MNRCALAAAALAAAGYLHGCAAPAPVRTYTLQADAAAAPAATPFAAPSTTSPSASSAAGPALVLDIAPIALPERLRRRQIVLREDGAQLRMLEGQRWSAALNDELQDALSAALQARLHAVDASRAGVAGKADYRINIEFPDLDARLGGPVLAAVAWSVRPAAAGGGQRCLARFQQAADGPGVADVVLAHQRLVAQVADAIAASVRAAAAAQSAPHCTAIPRT